jgi:hypothetical protein
MKTEFRDVNLFREGAVVDVCDITDMQGVTITRIADSGVTIKGGGIRETVISGKSPACLARNVIKQIEKKIMDTENNNNTNTDTSNTTEAVAVATEAVSPVRGKYKDALAAIKLPELNTFTIKQISELNGLPIPYAVKWVNENCVEVGNAAKPAGQRGRVAKLYKMKE